MKKSTIIIPSGYRYIGSETRDAQFRIDIEPGIYSKPTGIGFTTAVITDMEYDAIILVPRK